MTNRTDEGLEGTRYWIVFGTRNALSDRLPCEADVASLERALVAESAP